MSRLESTAPAFVRLHKASQQEYPAEVAENLRFVNKFCKCINLYFVDFSFII